MKTMLLSFAHPDDESFAVGGTVAKYVKAGWTVHLLCATKGEAGKGDKYSTIPAVNFGLLREKELTEAVKILGISSVSFMGYFDGKLDRRTPGDIEDVVFRKMMEIRPDVVITFGPEGITNHPDHIKMSTATTYAFQKYVPLHLGKQKLGSRDPRRYLLRDSNEESTEPKLYYICIPESITEYLQKLGSIPTESFGKPWKGVEDRKITTVIDISRFSTTKKESILVHETQEQDVLRFLSVGNHPQLRQEHFILRMQGEHEVFMGNNDRVANRL